MKNTEWKDVIKIIRKIITGEKVNIEQANTEDPFILHILKNSVEVRREEAELLHTIEPIICTIKFNLPDGKSVSMDSSINPVSILDIGDRSFVDLDENQILYWMLFEKAIRYLK